MRELNSRGRLFRLDVRPRAVCRAACVLLGLWPASAAGEMAQPYYFAKPAGNGPFAAVVVLHDCTGLGPGSSGAPWRWASELTRWGYVTIWPDSFSQRGHPRGVCTDASPPRITREQRADDAYEALRHLRSLPYVDARRVAVMGGSHGGASTLATIVDASPPQITREQRADDAYEALAYLRSLPFVDARRVAVMGGSHGGASTLATIVEAPYNAARRSRGFAAAIALYPNCGRGYGGWSVERKTRGDKTTFAYAGAFKPLAPLLILTGELDDWTPAEPCRQLAEAARAAGYPVTIKVYPGAHHSFDSLAPVRHREDRINANSPSGRGATTGGNAEAWADAVIQVERFLAQHVRK